MSRVIVLGVCLAVAGLLAVLVLLFPTADADRIYIHMVIHGVPVGGMTPEEAMEALRERFQPELASLRIRYTLEGEEVAERGYEAFGAHFDFTEVVESAQVYGQVRNLWRRLTRLLGRAHEITTPPVFRFDPARIENEITEIAGKLHRPPVNARLSHQNGQIVVLPEKPGLAIDTALAIAHTQALLAELAEGTIALTPRVLPPRYTTADLNFTVSVLGAYQTFYLGGFDDPRIRNINKAAGRIHNQVIFPEEIFSTGTVIGAHLPNSGYEAALVLVRGEPVEDIGGGVCQVATTLYNAVLRSELKVVQRHNHSARVSYADFGFDATLAGDWYDLKFKNNTPKPILITAEMGGGRLHIALHGLEGRPAGRTIRFTSERTGTTEPGPYKEIVDAALAPGQRVITLESVMGYTYEVFKHVYMHNQAVERIQVNTSTYRPLPGVVSVGR
ncbi:MAG: VanW family protein [Defluviitaleaceae bacterium]|nr:VanW family protein [Defluviitaleaceae bacterium]MCL2239974.1 VanW family protein [Defluviitaleaceae bacterium]